MMILQAFAVAAGGKYLRDMTLGKPG